MDFRQLVSASDPSLTVRLIRILLRIPASLYWLASQSKNWAYATGIKSATASGLPTISVGNLSVGGTGKSPVVAWLARELRSRGWRVAILSRGYNQLENGINDEALELERLLPDVPHLQHWDRIASAQIAREELDMQCLLLDDAFQHRRISRDLDIVLLDATDPTSARHVLPAGLYREPFSNLRRADVVMLTRVDQVSREKIDLLRTKLRRVAHDSLVIEARHRARDLFCFPDQTVHLSELQGKKILAFCGIGNPNAFFATLEDLGALILDRLVWTDHHNFDQSDVRKMQEWSARFPEADWVICTMKDSVKLQLPALSGHPIAALRISLGLENSDQEKLLEAVNSALGDTLVQ